ncbi:hypothetical protein C6P46_006920 [Rhodotorula mucilaginosa]|jgi:hypothetical protein|uniref:Uncharacterized protein n=1 Tax=Rhodotorula mucilaginosa TaxID=5537 RepID=A0A9P6VWB3_RHOMI|nr:hypothetical protein C6P46_006920 [Rhodotorula mucilaginosa]
MSATPAAASTPSSTATATTTRTATATVTGSAYLEALAQFIKRHEAALASYNAPRPKPSSAAPSSPSWTTVLTLGIVPTREDVTSNGPAQRRGKEPLVLRFDPHHLYYLLLKFDEIGLPSSSSGDLDVRVEGGTTRPMMVSNPGESHQGNAAKNGDNDGASLFGSIMFGRSRTGDDDDTRSIQSGMSSFSFGSGWWGLGGGGSKAKEPLVDEAATVRYIYSSCTKLPALRLSPFQMSASLAAGGANGSSSSRRGDSVLSRVVEGFEDCPPPATCVPLTAFKNLSSLVLEDLDPRGFLGWDLLSLQLRSLAIHRGGIEDVGELICDAPAEDFARRTQHEERRNKPVGTERRRRAEGANGSLLAGGRHVTEEEPDSASSSRPATPTPTTGSSSTDAPMYPTPPRLAWTSLRHLSLSDNSLTFIPSPPLTFLPTLTSLDLSSNLLITIPPALAHLTSLRSLDLSDNMIDSLLGIAKALGAIEVLNLSQNRIENLSGLDRLPALERLDVRSNAVYDVLEVSRLARLPHLREVWLAGNPLTTASRLEGGKDDSDDKWRVKCFGYFAEEQALGHRDLDAGQVRIDGKTMSSSERRALEAEYLSRQGRPIGFGFGLGRRKGSVDALRGASDRLAEEARNGEQAKVVGRRVVTAPHRHPRAPSPPPPSLPPLPSTSTARSSSPGTTPQTRPDSPSHEQIRKGEKTPVKAKRRKPQRIVDLDAPPQGRASADGGTTDSDRATKKDRTEATAAAAAASLDPRQKQPRSPRRDRAVPSLSYDAPPGDSSSSEAGSGGSGGEAFRRKIEALRSEVGESWLSVLSEREAREEQERREREAKTAAERKEEGKLGALSKSDTTAEAVSPIEAKDSTLSRTPPAMTQLPSPPPPNQVDPTADENATSAATPSSPPSNAHLEPTATHVSDTVAAQSTSEVEEDTVAAEAAATVVPTTTVKSVRKKRGKGKKKGGGGR